MNKFNNTRREQQHYVGSLIDKLRIQSDTAQPYWKLWDAIDRTLGIVKDKINGTLR